MPAERYLESAALLAGPTAQELQVVIPAGELNEARLVADGETDQAAIRFLRFVQAPMNPIEIARFNQRPDRDAFDAPGRLARVGILARILDAALVASLLVRGKVPGGTAAAAKVKYDGLRRADPRVSYHGRVSRRGGWVFLQYLFFYPMNDWRSTFDGANDHEADWEQAFVILEELPDGSTRPIWFAAAAHDEHGADLRRRWDDPKLQKDGDHVIVFPGAGSHATYMERGEYIMRLPLPGERLLHGVLDVVRRMWRDTLNQPDPGDLAEALKRLVSVPFVDYARGDGLTVGPGQEVEWSPIIISDATPWVDGYRGLWGLDTGDRLAGERAPAGPKYTRTGSVRQSWNDPARVRRARQRGDARPTTRDELVARIATLEAERAAVIEEADALSAVLPGMGIEVRALADTSGVEAYRERRAQEVKAGETRLAALRSSSAELKAAIAAAQRLPRPLRRRLSRRPALAPLACRGAGAAGHDEPPRVRRDLGGPERRRPRARPRGHPVVPPAADRADPPPARDRLPRDRVVRPAARRDAPAADHRDPGGDRLDPPRVPLPARAAARRAGRARAVHPRRQRRRDRPGAARPSEA